MDFRDDSIAPRSSPVPQGSSMVDDVSGPAPADETLSPTIIAAGSPSPAPQAVKKRSAIGPLKGIAVKKPAVKRRKLDGTDKDITSKPKKATAAKRPIPSGSDASLSGVFCICRTSDDESWMIACDGGCDDWYHGKCVSISEDDSELIDKYICPTCSDLHGAITTFKPMCRMPGCRKPARVESAARSKYCSDEHGLDFMKLQLRKARSLPTSSSTLEHNQPATQEPSQPQSSSRPQPGVLSRGSHPVRSPLLQGSDGHMNEEGDAYEDLGAKGSILSAPEVKSLVTQLTSAAAFRSLGYDLPHTPSSINVDLSNLRLTAKETDHTMRCRQQLADLYHDLDRIEDREKLLAAIRHNAKVISDYVKSHEPKGAKGLCLYDSRLSWQDDDLDDWRASEDGKQVLASGVLPEAAFVQSGNLAEHVVDCFSRDPVANLSHAGFTDRLCLKRRKCEKHHLWSTLQQEDIYHEARTTRDAIKRIEAEVSDAIIRASCRTVDTALVPQQVK
ncbi:hypothetical protein KEM52_000852 [Ascosphaera acerosa]|nr:hypothetical protein KEM52_000852 [Ascosphaera acerosa]